ncbi:uncharacterized protein LOC120006204 [Tripterygium wilfordii]|uniref:uncharacterized protein LOC120006204 n=1 Tax=Tripterygium wilfordii TaxID=458696 RepID=UPI0018F7ED63|nr:uncharacterized protein LOC120006204 [Tripterygium wilfordii]XP_038712078.1 uncharacterized protein LOC120006204 [Tripterygium wilfordii]XP_038712079.1 uncharacterized protein LOC120006204 [Tripterygium wilfordii]
MSTKKKLNNFKADGLEPRRKTKRSRREKRKATAEKLSAKLAKKKAKTQLMKKGLDNSMAKLEEMESECARMREEYKLAIEENVDLQLSVDYVLFAFLRGGHGGS